MTLIRAAAAVIAGIAISYIMAQQLEGVLVRMSAGRNLYTAGDYFAVRNTAGILAARLILTLVTAVFGGYVVARIARTDPVRYASIAAAALTVMLVLDFTTGEFAWGTPAWMRVALVVITGPALVAGAAIRAEAARLTSADDAPEPPPARG